MEFNLGPWKQLHKYILGDREFQVTELPCETVYNSQYGIHSYNTWMTVLQLRHSLEPDTMFWVCQRTACVPLS